VSGKNLVKFIPLQVRSRLAATEMGDRARAKWAINCGMIAVPLAVGGGDWVPI